MLQNLNLTRLLSLALSLNKSPTVYPSNAFKSSSSIFRALSSKSSSGDSGSWDEGWDAAVESSPNTSQDHPSSSSSSSSPVGWDSVSSWSTGLTKDHFDGQAVGVQLSPEAQAAAAASLAEVDFDKDLEELERENRRGEAFVNGWGDRMRELSVLMKQVREPGARGSYLKDSEKAEMYRKHKEDPETYTVERLAKDYRILRQRVHAILWLKELEEEEEKKLGRPLYDCVEQLLDTCPE